MNTLTLTALPGIREIAPGDDLAGILGEALRALDVPRQRQNGAQPQSVLVVAQKIVSKAEDRYVRLDGVTVSPRAAELAELTRKDPRLVELVLGESVEVLRAKPDVLIVRHRLGYVMANAGIDRSNVGGNDRVLLLPVDPDGSAEALAAALLERYGFNVGVIVCDSFGRPWRKGVTNVALGAAGVPALLDRRGEPDRHGRRLEVTEIALADQLASAAGLLMGEGAESRPAVLVRGLALTGAAVPAARLIRPLAEDLFR
ncbi:MAG TPA: coenzyme F420-0:L-glutamate ligase [Steroidobacteraceae bacterium]|nr:coenzyme F420-0:L-glutamate ligase [Steroidobacteraceae bacterium]